MPLLFIRMTKWVFIVKFDASMSAYRHNICWIYFCFASSNITLRLIQDKKSYARNRFRHLQLVSLNFYRRSELWQFVSNFRTTLKWHNRDSIGCHIYYLYNESHRIEWTLQNVFVYSKQRTVKCINSERLFK